MYHPKSSFKRSYVKTKSSVEKKTEKEATICLPPSWSGLVSVDNLSSQPPKKPLKYSTALWPVNSQSNLRGVIFRNCNPIIEILPFGSYYTNKDALRSLKSLDNHLQKEIQSGSLDEDHDLDEEAKDGSVGNESTRNEGRKKCSAKYRPISTSDSVAHKCHVHQVSNNERNDIEVTRIDDDDGPTQNNQEAFYRQDSVSTLQSLQLDFTDLTSPTYQPYRPTYLSSRSSDVPASDRSDNASLDYYDAASLSSSTGSLMFTSRESRRAAQNEIKSPRYTDDHLSELSKLIGQLSNNEGQKRNNEFQRMFDRICDVTNNILSNIPAKIFPFSIKKVVPNDDYETTASNCFEIYLTLELSKKNFLVSFEPNNCILAHVYVSSNNPSLDLFCTEDRKTKRRKFSPCKLMIILAHIINVTTKDSDVHCVEFPHYASVLFDNVVENEIRFSVKFPDSPIRYKVALVAALNVEDFPINTALRRNRQWPEYALKRQIIQEGVHLTTKKKNNDLHAWTVTFLKARRTLLQHTDETGNKLRLLLALQCLRESGLTNPDLILPCHLATILFWANIRYRAPIDWTASKLGKRFLDLVVALRRCLWKRECLDFFVPNVNMFESIKQDDCQALSFRIDVLLKDPAAYLKMKIPSY